MFWSVIWHMNHIPIFEINMENINIEAYTYAEVVIPASLRASCSSACFKISLRFRHSLLVAFPMSNRSEI